MSEFDIVNRQQVLHGKDVRAALICGLTMLAKAVRVTLGPSGRNAAIFINRPGSKPHLTKDGVTVAKSINPTDPTIKMGVEFVKEVSKQACDEAGDGTTTATVLAESIVNQCMDRISTVATANPVLMQRGIDYAAKCLQEQLRKNCLPCDTLEQMIRVATISANGDEEIGTMAANAVYEAGEYGCVLVEEAKKEKDELYDERGMKTEYGYVSPAFITDKANQTQVIENVKLVLINGKLDNLLTYEQVIKAANPKETLLFVAEEFTDALIADVIRANSQTARAGNICKFALLKSSGYGLRRMEMLEDLAVYTNGLVTGTNGGVPPEDFTYENCGFAYRITLNSKSGIINSDSADEKALEGRIKVIKAQLDACTKKYETSRLKERLGLLAGRVFTIKVGAQTQIGMRERKDRYDDAVCAVMSARAEGILPGGGTALIEASLQLGPIDSSKYHPEFIIGYDNVLKAITAPAFYISENAGLDGEQTINCIIDYITKHTAEAKSKGETLLCTHYGFNAATGCYGNMIDMNVLDPTKVTCSAIRYASAIAGAFITTEVGIVG